MRLSSIGNFCWRSRLLLGMVIGLVIAFGLVGQQLYKHYRWKRFATVTPGRLYRSGALRPEQLALAIDQLKLRRVICLEAELAGPERAVCAQRHVEFLCWPMPADGCGEPEQFAAILERLREPVPTLIHCSAGVARTGATIALFRVHDQGWKPSDALAELRSFERRGRLSPELQQHLEPLFNQLPTKLANPVKLATTPHTNR